MWCRASKLVKQSREMTLMTKPRTQTHFNQRQFSIGQKRLRSCDAKLDQILMRSGPGRALELARKMKTTHACDPGQFRESHIVGVVLGNKVHHLPKFWARKPAGVWLDLTFSIGVVTESMNR